MIAREIDLSAYAALRHDAMSVFDTAAFHQIVRTQCDEHVCLLFEESKPVFALAAGRRGEDVSVAFSAPYGFYRILKRDPRVSDYQAATAALVAWARARGLATLRWTMPASFYAEGDIAKAANALLQGGFVVDYTDINFHVPVPPAGDGIAAYAESIDVKARQKLRGGLKHDLVMERVDDDIGLTVAYELIQRNRAHRGFPLRLTLDRVRETVASVPHDVFLLRAPDTSPSAAAICFRTAPKISQVIYWGNEPGHESLYPMNVLPYRMLEWYAENGIQVLDTGTSTDHGVPNLGLSDFKQSIGGMASLKHTFRWSAPS